MSVQVCREARAGHHVSSSVTLCLSALRQDISLCQKLVVLARLALQGALGICMSLPHKARVASMHVPPDFLHGCWDLNSGRSEYLQSNCSYPLSLSPASIVTFLIQKGYSRELLKQLKWIVQIL